MKALICDSNRSRVNMLVKDLKQLGLECFIIPSISNILQKLRSESFDLLVFDESSIGILTKLKKMDFEIPVIVVTDKNSDIDYERLITNDITGLIRRPYQLNFLKEIVEKAVKKRNRILDNQKTVAILKQKIKELTTLSEIVQAINSSLEPKQILQIIMDKTADLIKAEGWSVLLFDHDKQELVFEAAAGEAGKKLIGLRLKIGQGVAGWVAERRESLIVPDVTKDPRFYSGVDKKTKFTTKSILCVPMKSRDKIIGVVEVVNKIGGEPFNEDDLEIFENLVAHITIALENANMYRKMEEASLIDDLTKLYNIRYCNQVLEQLLTSRAKTQNKISLIFLDIDFFKLVDDNYGHLVGSETLKRVADRIKKVTRDKDISVRYGGDEYIVILPDTDKETAATIAERIRREIGQEPFDALGNKKFTISVTLGVATYPDDAKDRDQLIGKADKAMYKGKATGRNRVVLA